MKKILSAAVLIVLIATSLASPASAERDAEDSDHVCALKDSGEIEVIQKDSWGLPKWSETLPAYIVLDHDVAMFLSQANNENWNLTKDGAICNELSSHGIWGMKDIDYTYWGQCSDDEEFDNIYENDCDAFNYYHEEISAFRTIELSDLEAAANGTDSCIDKNFFVGYECVAQMESYYTTGYKSTSYYK